MDDQTKTEGQVHLVTGLSGGQAHIITESLLPGEEKTQIGAHSAEQIVLKHGDALLITDTTGDMPAAQKETGLFWQGTRFLNICNLTMGGNPLIDLSHHVSDNGEQCQIDATNAPFVINNEISIEQGKLHVCRVLELRADTLIQTITITNFHTTDMPVTLEFALGADFYDMFDVRGFIRIRHGICKVPVLTKKAAILGYYGVDHVERETHISFTPAADYTQMNRTLWHRTLIKGQPVVLQITCVLSTSTPTYRATQSPLPLVPPTITTDDLLFNRFLTRSSNDFVTLCTPTTHGYFPYAGLPLFSCPFGRDGLITCLEFLPWFPDVVKGVLTFLAAHQGIKVEPFTDEEPGKILHEYRTGELANLREVPYLPYYGSVDATPLFLVTLEKYVRWTNDIYLLRQLWPNVVMAARWLTTFGDKDGDGFIEYHRASAKGLINQGWKDTWDSVSHADGRLAHGPVALCEVQGYAFAAYRAMGYLAGRLGKRQDSQQWEQKATTLQEQFMHSFWWEAEQTFYLALDGAKEPCAVVASNAGHCLWTGIVPAAYAQKLIARLMREDMASGWGIRTLSTHATRYNPMSYHNGSVWPHDTALVGAGFAQHDRKTEAVALLHSLYTASQYYEGMRLPELYCGFTQHPGFGPTRYAGACSPQAWAAGAPFLLLNGLLGLQPQAEQQCLTFVNPTMPSWLHTLEIQGMKVRGEQVHLRLIRIGDATEVVIEDDNRVDIEVL